MIQRIKADLPNVPDQVIETWLVPIAESSYGWPPDPSGLGKWRYALMTKGLDYWRKSTWELNQLSLAFKDFVPLYQGGIVGLVNANTAGIQNEYSNIENSRERFLSLCDYILQHRTFPIPPVVGLAEGGLTTIDGNHRIAALTYLRSRWSQIKFKKVFMEHGYQPPRPRHAT